MEFKFNIGDRVRNIHCFHLGTAFQEVEPHGTLDDSNGEIGIEGVVVRCKKYLIDGMEINAYLVQWDEKYHRPEWRHDGLCGKNEIRLERAGPPDASKMYPSRRRPRPTNESTGNPGFKFRVGDRVKATRGKYWATDKFGYANDSPVDIGITGTVEDCIRDEFMGVMYNIYLVQWDEKNRKREWEHNGRCVKMENAIEFIDPPDASKMYPSRRRPKPTNEGAESVLPEYLRPKFRVGDRVRNINVYWSSGLGELEDSKHTIGVEGVITKIEPSRDRDHLVYLVEWDQKYQKPWWKNGGLCGKVERSLELIARDASKMYKSRRYRPTNESVAESGWEDVRVGDRVRNMDNIWTEWVDVHGSYVGGCYSDSNRGLGFEGTVVDLGSHPYHAQDQNHPDGMVHCALVRWDEKYRNPGWRHDGLCGKPISFGGKRVLELVIPDAAALYKGRRRRT